MVLTQMFAIVRFLRDEMFDIVHLKDVQHFNYNKYKVNPNRKYKIKWIDGKVYEGVITHVAASKVMLEKKIAQNVRKLYSVEGLVTNSETEYDEPTTSKSQHVFESNKNKGSAELEKLSSKDLNENNKIKILSQNIISKDDQKKVNSNNIKEYKEYKQTEETVFNPEFLRSLEVELSEIKNELQRVKEENACLKTLNYKLQNEVIAKFNENKSELPIPNIEEQLIGNTYGGKVYLGFETYIEKSNFDYIMAHSKSSQGFTKNLAVAVYGIPSLIKSSVTGIACKNKKDAIAKPALDPKKISAIKETLRFYLNEKGSSEFVIDLEVQKVSTYIARKIVDLSRPPRNKKTQYNETDGFDVDEFGADEVEAGADEVEAGAEED